MLVTPKLYERDIRGRQKTQQYPANIPSHANRTPRPWTFTFKAGLLAHSSSLASVFPAYASDIWIELAVYSCGGSYGLTTFIINATHRIPIFAFDPHESQAP